MYDVFKDYNLTQMDYFYNPKFDTDLAIIANPQGNTLPLYNKSDINGWGRVREALDRKQVLKEPFTTNDSLRLTDEIEMDKPDRSIVYEVPYQQKLDASGTQWEMNDRFELTNTQKELLLETFPDGQRKYPLGERPPPTALQVFQQYQAEVQANPSEEQKTESLLKVIDTQPAVADMIQRKSLLRPVKMKQEEPDLSKKELSFLEELQQRISKSIKKSVEELDGIKSQAPQAKDPLMSELKTKTRRKSSLQMPPLEEEEKKTELSTDELVENPQYAFDLPADEAYKRYLGINLKNIKDMSAKQNVYGARLVALYRKEKGTKPEPSLTNQFGQVSSSKEYQQLAKKIKDNKI